MANFGFGTRPLMANANYVLPTDPNARAKPYPAPTGRPPTDFGNLGAVQPGMPYAKPVGIPGQTPPIKPPQFAPAINDLTPPTTVARPPRPTGGLTATRPYDPNRRRFGLRDPGGR